VTAVLHVLPHRGGGAETYLDLLERLDGVTHERLALSRSRSPLAVLPSLAFGGRRALRRAATQADLVHAHGDVAAALALPLLRSHPSVWTTHGLHLLRRARGPVLGAIRAGVREAVRATTVTLCCSRAEAAELAAIVEPALHDRLRVVPNGVDLPEEPRRVPHDGLRALYLGRLEDRKDPLTAVRAANRAWIGGAAVRLCVAGDGPLEQRVQAEATDAVEVLGFRRDVADLLRDADAFVLPSRREGISFAVLEAMAHGLAMVVAEEAGNREAVGDAGIILPAGDVEAFAAALAALAQDPVRRAALGAAARARVAEQFTVGQLLDGVRQAYGAAVAAG
jgi:glycosyltransferase involved in cell wall biosynthesis